MAYLHKTASIRLLFDAVLTNLKFLYSSARHRKRERPGMALAIERGAVPFMSLILKAHEVIRFAAQIFIFPTLFIVNVNLKALFAKPL